MLDIVHISLSVLLLSYLPPSYIVVPIREVVNTLNSRTTKETIVNLMA